MNLSSSESSTIRDRSVTSPVQDRSETKPVRDRSIKSRSLDFLKFMRPISPKKESYKTTIRNGTPTEVKILACSKKVIFEDLLGFLRVRWKGEGAHLQEEAKLLCEIRGHLFTKIKLIDEKILNKMTMAFLPVYSKAQFNEFECREERLAFSKTLTETLKVKHLFFNILMDMSEDEVAHTRAKETLFRENSLASSLSVAYACSLPNNPIKKMVNSFVTFLEKQKGWPEDYMLSQRQIGCENYDSVKTKADRLCELIAELSKHLFNTMKIEKDLGKVLKVRMEAVKEKFNHKVAICSTDSSFWLRIFGHELMSRISHSGEKLNSPANSLILFIHNILVKSSSRACESQKSDIQKVKRLSDNKWTREDYDSAIESYYDILEPYFLKFNDMYRNVKVGTLKFH